MTTSTLTVDADTGEVIDAEGPLAEAIADATGGELFNPNPYTTPVPTLDGHRADTLKLAFAGSVDIDAMLDDDLEHFKSLRFGQEVTLVVTGTVGKKAWNIKTNADTGDEAVTHTISISVHSYQVDGGQ